MGKRQLQITCCFGKEDAGELLFRSFLLFLRRELEERQQEETEKRTRELSMVREELDRLIERLHMLKNKVKTAAGEEQAE